MARIVVYSMAYRGDVFPYVPIASALSAAGHDVTYVVPREFHPLFEGEPFRCVHSGTDFGPTLLDEHADFVARWGTRLGGGMLMRLYFGELTVPHLDVLYEAIEAEVVGADLLLSHPAAAVVGSMAAAKHDVPVVVGDLFPMIMLTEYAPIASLPYLGRRFNRVLIKAARSSISDRMMFAKGFREFRSRLGLDNDGWNVMDARLSPLVNLGLVPSAYIERQPDWPDNYRLVGFTPWSGPDGGALDDELEEFLDAGDPPVVVTLGTSGASARPEVFHVALDTLDAHQVRGVFLASNDQLAARVSARAGTRHAVRAFAPLAALLDRARAILQSGAHGTNSLALLHGVPSVTMPCLYDQVAHARRQEELGTGVWAKRPRNIEQALQTVLADDRFREQARSFAAEIAHEDGTAATVSEVESLLS
jgi:UDP:flavonoid glycosyltransferase YjiC (YdhE family)